MQSGSDAPARSRRDAASAAARSYSHTYTPALAFHYSRSSSGLLEHSTRQGPRLAQAQRVQGEGSVSLGCQGFWGGAGPCRQRPSSAGDCRSGRRSERPKNMTSLPSCLPAHSQACWGSPWDYSQPGFPRKEGREGREERAMGGGRRRAEFMSSSQIAHYFRSNRTLLQVKPHTPSRLIAHRFMPNRFLVQLKSLKSHNHDSVDESKTKTQKNPVQRPKIHTHETKTCVEHFNSYYPATVRVYQCTHHLSMSTQPCNVLFRKDT